MGRAPRWLIDPGVPEPVEPGSLLRLLRIALGLDLLLVAGNLATRFGLGDGADLAVYDLYLATNLPAHAVILACVVSMLRSSGRIEELGGRLRATLAAAATTTVTASWLIGGQSVALNLAFATMLVGLARLYLGGRLGAWTLGAVVVTEVTFATLRVAGALPDHSAIDSYVLDDGVRVAGVVAWRIVVLGAFFTLCAYAANRYRQSEHQLRLLAAGLEQRVAAQVAELERAARLRRYLAPELVDELLAADEDPGAARDRRAITVLFADLRGFTGLVERMEPDALAALLERYFEAVTQVAFAHGGTVDKFIGDAVMVVFGAPRATGEADQARRCVEMAIAIQRRIAALGRGLEVRIGIASGVATVGTFGAAHRADYTAVGAPVNRAARLEPHAPGGGILVDARTRELVGDLVALEPFGELALKGFAAPEPAYRVAGTP